MNGDQFRIREAWVLCFFLGIVMLNFPFLQIFNKATSLFDIPLLLLYFFIGWPLSIAVIRLFSSYAEADDDGSPPTES